ncbi:MAG: nucleotide disphospho-sugar-binding domain-containing protein [Methylocella sp.]
MKFLIASTPATGHLNPLLAIGRILIDEGHEVVGISASFLRDRIEGIGAAFRAFPAGADLDLRDIDAAFPERKNIPLGPEEARFTMTRVFIDPVPAQHEGLKQVLRDFPADVIIADNLFLGALPMLLGPRSERPAIVLCGSTLLFARREDGAPHFLGLPPASSEAQRQEYAAIFEKTKADVTDPIREYLNDRLAGLGVRPLSIDLFDALIKLPDAYLQLTVPSFELPQRDVPDTVHFVGAVSIVPNQATVPTWADELDGSRKVVLVTQGTVNNFDFGQLVAPTLAALANEPDVLVIATAGGRPIDSIPGPIPSNVRLASYLPFEWVLPKIDALVTNGGYGSVNQALSFGVPLVTAGLTEDKADVNIRVAWSGVGINLATNDPTPQALREAIRAVLDQPSYRARASAMAKEFGCADTRSEILRILRQVSGIYAEEAAQ